MFERIDRIVTVVPDLDAAQSLFADTFGLTFDKAATDDDLQIKVVHAGRFGLELCQPMSDTTPIAAQMLDWLARYGPGVRAVVVKVTDMDLALDHLRARDVEPVAQMTIGSAREALLDPSATFNVPIILNQFTETHPMTAAAKQ